MPKIADIGFNSHLNGQQWVFDIVFGEKTLFGQQFAD